MLALWASTAASCTLPFASPRAHSFALVMDALYTRSPRAVTTTAPTSHSSSASLPATRRDLFGAGLVGVLSVLEGGASSAGGTSELDEPPTGSRGGGGGIR